MSQFYQFLLLFVLFVAPFSIRAQSVTDLTARYHQAEALYQEGEYEQSKDIFDEISSSLCSAPETTEECIQGKVYVSDIERINREFDSAENYLDEAEQQFSDKLDSPHPLEMRIYLQKVFLYVNMTNFEKARTVVEKALRFAEEPVMKGLPRGRAYIASAYLEDAIGNYHNAIQFYSEALQSVEHLQRNREVLRFLSYIYNNIGVLYKQTGDLQQAMNYYQQALEVTKSLYGENHPEIGLLFNNIGTVYYFMGDYGQAAEYFLRTAAIYKENFGENHPRVAGGYNNAGVVYHQLGDLDKSTENLEKAQRIKERLLGKHHLDTAIGYSNLATIYLEKEDYDAALENYQRSISIREEIYGPDHPNLVEPYIHLGEYYSTVENYSLAREQFREALRITKNRIGGNHPNIWTINLDIGNSYEEEKKYDEALEYFERAFTMMVDESSVQFGANFDGSLLSYPVLFMKAAKDIGDVKMKQYEISGGVERLHQAVEFYEIGADVVDFLQTSYLSEASKLNLIDQNYSIYTNAAKACYHLYRETDNEAWLDDMLYMSELSRSRIALELLQDIEAKEFAGIPEKVLENERTLNSKIAEYYQKLNTEQEKGFDADQKVIAAYRDSLFTSRQNLIRFTEELEQNYPDYFQLKYKQDFADRETISGILKPDETLVNYMITKAEIYVLILDREEISVFELAPPDSLSSKIKSLREAVSSGNTDQYTELAYSFYRNLMEPVMPAIHTSSIIVVPDQMLHYLPFEMLLTDPPGDSAYQNMPYLIREKRISYAPSATVLQLLTERKRSSPRNLFALAPFDETTASFDDETSIARYVSGLAPLPLTRYETREIAKLFEEPRSLWDYIFSEETEILLGHEATESNIENRSFEGYGYIHFATHAFVNESDPALSGIAFWGDENENDGIIYVNDIYNMTMDADLVVLGACETGLGTIYKGEGIIGFTRAFIYAGASNLLVSMWRVNDQPTADLMIQFYSYAREGYSYSESLQMAKLNLIEQPRFAAPRNWAAFVLQGR